MATLTAAQLTTFKADILANPGGWTVGSNNEIAEWYSQIASPDVWVLRNDIAVDDIVAAMDWATDYAAFKDDIPAIRFLLDDGTYDATSVQARDALNAVFAGAANTKGNVLATATRLANNLESLFKVSTTGPGGGDGTSQSSSAIPIVTGSATIQNVRDALAS